MNQPRINFEEIPKWSDADIESSFAILLDDINGRLPVTQLESWAEFQSLLESDFFNKANEQLIFRGQRRFDWKLIPSLAQLDEEGFVREEIAEKQLEFFRKAIRGRIRNEALLKEDISQHEEDELWSIGQHHKLRTPLLDWTHSPYVALFFAFQESDKEYENDNPYRAIYILNKTLLAKETDIRIVEPAQDSYGRLVSQDGLFTFSPYDEAIENVITEYIIKNYPPESETKLTMSIARYVCKICIKNDGRDKYLRHLLRMNIHHASLFPDIFGSADYCNAIIEKS